MWNVLIKNNLAITFGWYKTTLKCITAGKRYMFSFTSEELIQIIKSFDNSYIIDNIPLITPVRLPNFMQPALIKLLECDENLDDFD